MGVSVPPQPAPPVVAPPVVAPAPARPRFLTPGWFTSEGIIQVLVQILLTLNTTGAWALLPPKYTVLGQAIAAAGYAIGRGVAKTGSAGTR
jgi:hypothetical protein